MKTNGTQIGLPQRKASGFRERGPPTQPASKPGIIGALAVGRMIRERGFVGRPANQVEDRSASFVAGDDQDDQDMARLIRGDAAGIERLMDRYGKRLFRYLTRRLRDRTDAADQVQEAFVRVYRHRESFNFKNKFSTWLYAIATNLARDRRRWRSRQPEFISLNDGGEGSADLADLLVDQGPPPDEALEVKERFTALHQTLAALPETLRIPILLAAQEDRSQAEIAANLNCSIKAIEMRLYHGRVRLRAELKKKLTPLRTYENINHPAASP